MLAEFASDSEPGRAGLRVIVLTLALRGEYLGTLASIEGPLAAAITARTGDDGLAPGAGRRGGRAARVATEQ